jgi:hypothetical protein
MPLGPLVSLLLFAVHQATGHVTMPMTTGSRANFGPSRALRELLPKTEKSQNYPTVSKSSIVGGAALVRQIPFRFTDLCDAAKTRLEYG